MKEDSINKCQYWNQYEPNICRFWDVENTICKYIVIRSAEVNDIINQAEKGPYCNILGTSLSCGQYESITPGKPLARCILPDSRRHVCNRDSGNKWVTVLSGTDSYVEGIPIYDWSFDEINGYNEGQCDTYGTTVTCSGYSPYHLGFGVLKPSDEEGLYDTFIENRYSTEEEFGYRLPTNFVIYNIRAILSKCYWWKEPYSEFVVDDTGRVELSNIWACSCTEDTSAYSEFTLENGPPCNGCKPECSNYTGICWKYCIDAKMESGDPILAEQIHELRYYHREHKWTTEDIQSIFIDDGHIFTWQGAKTSNQSEDIENTEEGPTYTNSSTLQGNLSVTIGPNNYVEEYQIPVVEVFMPKFDKFTLETKLVLLTAGTEVTRKLKDYPTLIRHIQQLPLSPIIKTKLAKYNSTDGKSINFFDTPYLNKNVDILIYGKTFYTQDTYAVNISSKDINAILPQEIFLFDSIYDAEQALSEDHFIYFNTRLEAVLNGISSIMPEMVSNNTLPNEDHTFIMPVKTLFSDKTYNTTNENIILVWQKVNGYITYDKISFTLRVIGGILSQTDFSLLGDEGDTDAPQDFENDYFAQFNNNGNFSFDFIPFIVSGIRSKASFVYNASVMADSVKLLTFKGHKTFKLLAETYILSDNDHIITIGSNGYMLIDIDHPYLNSVLKPWEVSEINITYTIDNPNADEEGESNTISRDCEMEIVYHGSNFQIGSQQLIIKPKNLNNFSSICEDNVVITLKNLTYWEKRSYDQTPIEVDFESSQEYEVDTFYTLDDGEITLDGNEGDIRGVSLTAFGSANTPTIIILNSEGKPFTQYRTKALGMIKQPSCPDVEVFYNWQANYIDSQNKPICRCCGKWTQINPVEGKGDLAPFCGDHFQSPWQKKGPMWWPYNACREWDVYGKLTNLNNYNINVIGLFQLKNNEGQWAHGSFDMRMMGPYNYYGRTGIGCNPLMPCSCGMRTYNSKRVSDAVFTGYAKIRGGISSSQIDAWVSIGGTAPKFGNAVRPLLRSYRTLGMVMYPDPMQEKILRKLMPATMVFSNADFTSVEDEMWDFQCDTSSTSTINPLGFLLAGSFDNVDVNETIDNDNRFTHDQVFRCKWTVDIAYQKTVGKYVRPRGEKIIVPWYEFKRYPLGDGFIQWAWQEIWKPIERNYIVDDNKSLLDDFIMEYIDAGSTGVIKGPYIDLPEEGPLGRHLCLEVQYPSYEYDWKNQEFSLVLAEGEYELIFKAPIKDEYTGEYISYPSFSIGKGPKRGINWAGQWLTKDNQDSNLAEEDLDDFNIDLYKNCIGDTSKTIGIDENFGYSADLIWSEEVTLFGPGYDNESTKVAQDDGRMITVYTASDPGEKPKAIQTHFQRGLNVQIGDLSTLPLRVSSIDQLDTLGTDEAFEVICGITETVVVRYTFDQIKRTIGRFDFSAKFGREIITEATKGVTAVYKYYHIPQISIYKTSDGYTKEELLYQTNSMEMYKVQAQDDVSIVNKVFDWRNDWEYISNGSYGAIVEYRVNPTLAEIEAFESESNVIGRYNMSINSVQVINSTIFEEVLVDAIENLNVHERKYFVSYGGTGVLPPQGEDDDESKRVLGKRRGNDGSTVWQTDTSEGVYDVPESSGEMSFMNKVRGRHVFDLYEDNTLLTDDLITIEGKQKEMYDKAISKIERSSTMEGVLPLCTKELLINKGVTFQGPRNLSLTNSMVTPLAEINQPPPMYPEGNMYRPGPAEQEECNAGSACNDDDRFPYVYMSMDYKLAEYIEIFQVSNTGVAAAGFNYHEVDDSFVQFYGGAAFQVDRTMAFEELMDYHFPLKYDRSTSSSIWRNKNSITKLRYVPLGLISYGGTINDSYKPGGGYSGQYSFAPSWTTPVFWFFGSI